MQGNVFPTRMASEVAHRAIKKLPKGPIVLYPMVPVQDLSLKAASETGNFEKGFDLDPLAVL